MNNLSGGFDYMITMKCQICGKEFKVKSYRKDTAKFCSRKCKGIHFSNFLKENKYCIGRNPWNKERQMTDYPQCGFQKGHFVSPESIKTLQKWIKENGSWCKGKENFYLKGELNPNWKGGTTPLKEKVRRNWKYRKWYREVFQNYNYICQKCNQKIEKGLVTHHIKQFSTILKEKHIIILQDALNCKELWDTNNGITFCRSCHNQFHRIYGKANNNQEQLDEFLFQKIKKEDPEII